LEYIPLEELRQWDKNPKLHDIGAISQSIKRYGFKDPPKFEPSLNGGVGGIVEGNGRIEALYMMKRMGEKPPSGIILEAGEWYIPVLFGVDAKKETEAEAYGIDHNNITMMGGTYTPLDMAGIWDENQYLDLIKSLELTPVSVDWESLNLLDEFVGKDGDKKIPGEEKEVVCPNCREKFKI